MAIEEVEVSSLGELIDRVTPEEPDPVTGRRRYSGVYHGSGAADWPLLTSLDRLGGIDPPHTKAGLEEHILRNFIRYSRPYLTADPRDDWELLVAAQHHGVPTRLLDWSYSPLVAAHFATRREHSHSRCVWRLDWKRMHAAFDFPELALLTRDLGDRVGRSGDYSPWDFFREPLSGEGHFAFMLEPPSINARIVAQAAVFTLCTSSSVSFDRFLEEHGLSDVLTRFILPAAAVDRVRDQLDLVGMDERRLFPDLDGVAGQMRRYYS